MVLDWLERCRSYCRNILATMSSCRLGLHRFAWGPILAVSLLLTSCSLPQVSAESRLFAPIELEFIDDYTLPQTVFQDAPVGGLSGLTYDREKGVIYGISDDRSGFAPARFYTLKPKVDVAKATGQLEIKTVEIKAITTLKQENGEPYPRNKIDPEGIAISPRGTVFISSEGAAKAGVAPFLNEYDLATGQWIKSLPIPDAYLPSAKPDGTQSGVQDNKGFEGLTINADATADLSRLFVGIENPLEQDLPLESTNSSDEPPVNPKLRIIHYAVAPSRSDLIGEYVYESDPGPSGTIENGLADILSIDNAGHFLSLERSLGLTGFNAKIYQFTFAGARDVQLADSIRSLPNEVSSIRKKLVLDLSSLGITIDNVEGITLGSKLPDGSQSLWIVSDDNFSKDQVTQFLLFRLKTS
jgi:hypothetical protein